MQTIERTTGTAAQRPFGLVKGFVVAYGAMGAAVFGTIVALAAADGPASGFMWTRSALVPVSAAIMYWLVTLAARGSRRAYERARLISVVAPIALVGVDLIPGACPLWFLLLQSACAVLLACAAFPLVRMRATFPK
ncbi:MULTISPECIES: hypothetical protein [Amycolatopsis]|uniref:Uncharacterized protein n=1 Tax=Amycolatopsis dendrobii TaxID=2760662 RepID=A0A7W3ZF01_9PSEU|nr:MULTISPECIES: hypothetical protein [Amycolatopsis]MBB1158955.1 hypothetical protein [Amycolatopsis dendrobii]UKD55195.1 hypothetical protein L3Q65_46340 [Amycolatopsis sp. FU40]